MRRRSFLSRAFALGAGLALAGPRRVLAAGRGPYLDFHTHITQGWSEKRGLSAKALLEWMDANDVEQAVVLPLVNPEAWYYPIPTAHVLEETRPHRDRLIPFCCIDPRTVNLGDTAARRDLLRRYQDQGARGLGESKPGVAIDDPRNLELFGVAAEAGLPVLFHLDELRNLDQPGLPGLASVLRQLPQGIFIGHGPGWWASISGEVAPGRLEGYPEGPVAPGGALDALFERFPNLYGDLSANSGLNAITRDPGFGRDFLERRQDRLLFGTDYLEPGQEVGQFRLLEQVDLPDVAKAKIARDNARRLLAA